MRAKESIRQAPNTDRATPPLLTFLRCRSVRTIEATTLRGVSSGSMVKPRFRPTVDFIYPQARLDYEAGSGLVLPKPGCRSSDPIRLQ